jgi:ligand-binding sensor domain-containing protein
LSDNIGVLQAFVEDATGDIWAGTSRGILLRVRGEELVDETTLIAGEGSSICALHVAEDGSLWMGFAGAGLGRLKDRQFSRATSAQGLYNDNISQILSDESGWLWFGSEHGIFKVSQAELEAVTEGRAARVRSVHYGRDEGLKRLKANYGNSPMAVR